MTILGSIDIILWEVDCWNDNWYKRSIRYQFFYQHSGGLVDKILGQQVSRLEFEHQTTS